ncbi:MAG: hypothetical protein GX573_22005 [Chloroflexi bacterium]|nr:hypothetical protein [Chloroflexota bacterium]
MADNTPASMATEPLPAVKAERDRSIDYLKGFVCALMVIAHAPMIFADSPGAWLIRQMISPGTAIFFGLAAETALLQRRRYGFRPVSLTYVWLFFLGANLTPLLQHFGRFDHLLVVEILTMIAVGCLFILLLDEYLHPGRWGYLAITLALVLCRLGISEFGRDVNWPLFLAVKPGAVEYLPDGSARVYPGFSLIPWLGTFPLVQFLRRSSTLSNLIVSLICSAGIVLLMLTGQVVDLQLDLFNKWETTPAYMLWFCAFNSLFFALFAREKPILPYWPAVFITLGKNSFSYLYAHMFGIFFGGYVTFFLFNERSLLFQHLPFIAPVRQYLLWLTALLLSILLTRLIMRIPRLEVFRYTLTWLVLLALIYVVPLVVPIFVIVWLLEYVFGILMVIHFPVLLESLRRRAAPQPAASGLAPETSARLTAGTGEGAPGRRS